jgi:glucosylceramidase
VQYAKTESLDAVVDLSNPLQTIDGFGACFNELGLTSLALLKEEVRDSIMKELFEPDYGANFTICRMPVGANDFSRNWYSYDETANDFNMKNFSIANDEETLIPFIKNAKKFNPNLKIWASPWSPPSWMKTNNHYACHPDQAVNDLKGDPAAADPQGSNMFIMKDEYLRAYALYFGLFIDAYKQKGIDIYAVAPQNEFHSCQVFPSCLWTASALAAFTGKYLGPEMEKRGVEILFGTNERPDEATVDTLLTDSLAIKYIKAVGFQWGGKEAVAGIHRRYPQMKLYQTEQECGDGQNNWDGAVHSWNLMKSYLSNGVSVYDYWNIALLKGGISRWGWAQNSLVTVDSVTKAYAYNYEYYVMKHYSGFVKPGAKRLKTSGYDDIMAFVNPDDSIVIVAGNQTKEDKPINIRIGNRCIRPTLKAGSFNTFLIGK